MAATAEHLQRLIPSVTATTYDLTDEGERRRCGHTLTSRRTSWADIGGHEYIPGLARYQYRPAAPPDGWSNKAVRENELFLGDAAGLDELREKILVPCGGPHQLRVALYDGRRFLGLAVLIRSRSEGEFGERDQAILQAVAPALVDGFMAMRTLTSTPGPSVELTRVLEVLDQPAYLVTDGGAVVHLNESARGAPIPAWLRACIQATRERRRFPHGHAHEIDIAGKQLWLVIARERLQELRLPPSLAAVAEGMMVGLSDKEIAQQTSRPLRTVRTYVHRIYHRVGVRSRIELLRRVRGNS